MDFKKFSEAEDLINQPYDEAYISVLFFDDTPYFVEHNDQLDVMEVGKMVGTVTGALFKMNSEKDNQDT